MTEKTSKYVNWHGNSATWRVKEIKNDLIMGLTVLLTNRRHEDKPDNGYFDDPGFFENNCSNLGYASSKKLTVR